MLFTREFCSQTCLPCSVLVFVQDLPLCWDQHSKLLPVVNKYSVNDVMRWSSEQVAGFVNCLPGCNPHGKVFHEEVLFYLVQCFQVQCISNLETCCLPWFFARSDMGRSCLQQVDGEAFLLLTQADIVKVLSIKLGPALKIYNSIVMFKNNVEV